MYRATRRILFAFDPETSHYLGLHALARVYALPFGPRLLKALFTTHSPQLATRVMGIDFPNPIGLAAGLDKDAAFVGPLSCLGFGWLELGTVTPQPQAGNPRPRLFRLPAHAAILNRMGFNNSGLQTFVNNLRRTHHPCLIGANLGKNKDTPLEHAANDYTLGMQAVYDAVDYIAINISSPNTAGLRDLQDEKWLMQLLTDLKETQSRLRQVQGRYVPLAVKIAPDLSDDQLRQIARNLRDAEIDAVIATNTTITRPGLTGDTLAGESGGLSGAPLKSLATRAVTVLFQELRGNIPIIGVGGITTANDAWERLVAGADLIQIYTAMIYEGPGLAATIAKGLQARVIEMGYDKIRDAVVQTRAASRL